jgi:hypothetical protein
LAITVLVGSDGARDAANALPATAQKIATLAIRCWHGFIVGLSQRRNNMSIIAQHRRKLATMLQKKIHRGTGNRSNMCKA